MSGASPSAATLAGGSTPDGRYAAASPTAASAIAAATVARALCGLPNVFPAGRPAATLAISAPSTQPTQALPIAVRATPGKAAATRPRSQGWPTAHAIHATPCGE